MDKKLLIAIIVILLVVVVALMTLVIILTNNGNNLGKNDTSNGSTLNISNVGNNTTQNVSNETNTIENTTIGNNDTSNQNVAMKQYTNLLNSSEEGTYCNNTYDEVMGLRLFLQYDGKVYFYLDDKSNFINVGMEANVDTNTDYEITGFTGKVVDTFIGISGNGITYPIAYFLMEDGTVWYLNTETFMINGNTKAQKDEGIEGVIRLKQANLGVPNDGGWLDIIGIKADGSYYKL